MKTNKSSMSNQSWVLMAVVAVLSASVSLPTHADGVGETSAECGKGAIAGGTDANKADESGAAPAKATPGATGAKANTKAAPAPKKK